MERTKIFRTIKKRQLVKFANCLLKYLKRLIGVKYINLSIQLIRCNFN